MDTKQTTATTKPFLQAPDVARLAHYSVPYIRYLARTGRMPKPLKIGGRFYWVRRAIEAWVAQGHPDCRDKAKSAGGKLL